ncbi:hypothetical protein CsatB_029365 [Cannabis sativa]
MDTPPEAAKLDSDAAELNSNDANDESATATETGEPEKLISTHPNIINDSIQKEPSTRVKLNHPKDLILGNPKESMITMAKTKNLGQQKWVEESDATPSNAPPAAPILLPAAATASNPGDSLLPQRESQPVKPKPKRIPKQVVRKSVRPYKCWTSSSSYLKGSPPPATISLLPAIVKGVATSTPTGPSTHSRAQKASIEKEIFMKRSHDKLAPPAKKLKLNPPSISSSSEEEEPMQDPSVDCENKSIEDTELEPESPLPKSTPTPPRGSSATKASAAAKGKQPMKSSSPGNISPSQALRA